ncbi:MAG: IS110 family transposase [Treponema sp.]|jgi:transposase|nr:IS110 family transposase [Treponema sp.]
MRIVRPICCGADIHKDLIVATIAATNQDGITEYIQSSFSSQNFDLVRLKAWLIEHHCFEIAMESTGKYWIPVFNVLEGEIKVFVVHPKYTKAIKGKKTDKKDSKWIADLFKHDLLKFSFIPPKEIRELRELSRYRIKLIAMRSSERNRYQNSMTISNIGLASILSDPFGKSSRAVMKEVIRSSSVTEEKISKLLERNAKKKVKEVLQSLVGSHIESDQRLKMNIASQHMDQIDSHVRRLETEMAIRCIPYATLINLLLDIPGISYLSAMTIIAEIGTDMSVFETSKQLSCWAGLAPANNESASKKKSVRISKAGSYLKPLLVQCALAAINSKSNPYYRIKYNRIKKRRGHKKAIIAIARMILVNIYHILSTGEVYSPCDMEQIINPKPVKKVMTIQNAIEFLQSQGFDTSKLISSSS